MQSVRKQMKQISSMERYDGTNTEVKLEVADGLGLGRSFTFRKDNNRGFGSRLAHGSKSRSKPTDLQPELLKGMNLFFSF